MAEETKKIVKDQNSKSSDAAKSNEINKSKLTEQKSSRIVKETEERIEVIKKKLETERIETTTVTT